MSVRILTHNVYWFQGSPSRWGGERVAAVPEVVDGLTELYADAHADLLCLQEVHQAELVDELAARLTMPTGLHARGGRQHDYGGAILGRDVANLRDLTCNSAAHERVHLRASLKLAGSSIELAMIHLPSNRFAASEAAGEAARVAELQRAVTFSPRARILVGDLNCAPGSVPYRFMIASGYIDAATLAGGNAPEQENIRDYIWVDKQIVGQVTAFQILDGGRFQRVDADGQTWSLSDHPPLAIDLR